MSPTSRADALPLTVVIPVKDDARHLERCLEAIARQGRPPREVVVVDNASTDDSADVARRAGARVVVEPSPGIPAAASTGYDAVASGVIVRCDADTMPPPDWLERVHEAFAADPGLTALTGSGRFYDLPVVRARLAQLFYMRCYYWGCTPRRATCPCGVQHGDPCRRVARGQASRAPGRPARPRRHRPEPPARERRSCALRRSAGRRGLGAHVRVPAGSGPTVPLGLAHPRRELGGQPAVGAMGGADHRAAARQARPVVPS